MSQAEALLNTLSETAVEHKHVVPDSDTYFLINPYTREIENTTYNKTVLMRGDHNSERFTFEIPRYVDGHDMSLCNRVIVHFDNVGESIYDVYSDIAYMTDLRINPDNPETVISSWLIRREATQIVGILSFSLQYQCVEGEEITYEWNTDSYDEIEIRKSKNNGEGAIIQYTNVLEEWRSRLFGAGDSVMANITTEGANQVTAVKNESATQQAAIKLKGSETLATIPDDYTEVYNMAEEALRTKADGIVCEVEGTDIAVSDASDDYLRGLNIYGKSSQFTTTGKNLFDSDPDNIQLIDKTEAPHYGYIVELPAGTYTISATKYIDTYLYAAIYDGTSVGENYYIVLPTEVRPATVTINDGDVLYLYNAITYTSTPGMKEATKEAFAACSIQIEAGDTATDYEPYTGGNPAPNPEYPQEIVNTENPTVHVTGKNLFDPSKLLAADTWTEIDGVYSGYPAEAHRLYNQNEGIPLVDTFKKNTQYVLSFYCRVDSDVNKTGLAFSFRYSDGTSTFVYPNSSTGKHEQFISTPGKTVVAIHASYGSNIVTYLRNIQLEEGYTVTEYEPYSGGCIMINSTLRAAPVATGANYIPGSYTDANGQEWICDEVDLERGVLIQRLYSRVFDGADNEMITRYAERENVYGFTLKFTDANMEKLAHAAYCTHFENIVTGISSANKECFLCGAGSTTIYVLINKERLSEYSVEAFKNWLSENPITIVFQLATPIETPLTADEIETFKALKSNYPNTTVLNDAGAMMKLKYVADTKLYVDNTALNGAASIVEEVLNDTY